MGRSRSGPGRWFRHERMAFTTDGFELAGGDRPEGGPLRAASRHAQKHVTRSARGPDPDSEAGNVGVPDGVLPCARVQSGDDRIRQFHALAAVHGSTPEQ